MRQISVSYFEELPQDVEDRIHKGHIRDEAAKGIVCNYKRFSIVAIDKLDEIVAALTAYTAFSEVC